MLVQNNLSAAFMREARISLVQASKALGCRDFRSLFGVGQSVCADIWRKIYRHLPGGVGMHHLLWSLSFMKVYGRHQHSYYQALPMPIGDRVLPVLVLRRVLLKSLFTPIAKIIRHPIASLTVAVTAVTPRIAPPSPMAIYCGRSLPCPTRRDCSGCGGAFWRI